MSDDPSPPDFIDTADFPLDESALKHIPLPALDEDPPPAGGSSTEEATLFTAARPLGLETSASVGDGGAILENAARAPASAAISGEVRPAAGFLNTDRIKGLSFYRRQSTVAAVVLCALTAIVIITFPSREKEVEGEVVAGAAEPDPAGAAVDGNDRAAVDAVGSEGFFRRSKSEPAITIDDRPVETSPDGEQGLDPEVGQAVDDSVDGVDPSAPDATTVPPGQTGQRPIPITTQAPEPPETSVFVGPGPGFPTTPVATPVPTTRRPAASVVVPTATTTEQTTTEQPTTERPTTSPPTTEPTTATTVSTTENTVPSTTRTTAETTLTTPTTAATTTVATTTPTTGPTTTATSSSVPEESETTRPPVANCESQSTTTTDPSSDDPEAPTTTVPCQPDGGTGPN